MVETSESAGELLTTLLGDYWFGTADHIPSGALTAVLGDFGIGAEATRAALSRATRRGRLEGMRMGRNTAYRLAPALHRRATKLGRRLMAFGAAPLPWDGTWTCVAFSVPEPDRRRRRALRDRLRKLGFGVLFDGLWVSPRAASDELDAIFGRPGTTEAVVFRATEVTQFGGADLLSAWDLDAIRDRYEAFCARLDDVLPRIEAGVIGAADALAIRTDALLRWRGVVGSDPGLPDELVADLPRAEARRRFVAVYDSLGPLAEARVRQLVAPYPSTPPPRHHLAATYGGRAG